MTGWLMLGAAMLAAPQTFVLNTSLNVWDVAVEDLDRDGHQDILALCCDEMSYPLNKYLAVFLADAQGRYPGEPTLRLNLEPSVGSLLLTETDGEAPRELVAINAEGGRVYRFADGDFDQSASVPFTSLLPDGSKEPRFLRDAALDLDGDGSDEWLIPVASGFDVYNVSGRRTSVTCDVVSEIRSYGSIYITHRLPAVHPFELPDTGTKGLAFLSDEFADFHHGSDWSQRKRFKIPVDLEEKWDANASMKDIDGNGLPDLIVTQTRGTINMETLTQIYIAEAPFTYPESPTAVFEKRRAFASPGRVDVDGDEQLDLVYISIPIGVGNFISFFVRGKLGVDAQVYLFKDGGFTSEPVFETSLSMDAPEGREEVAYTMGDFNGDGRIDLGFGKGNDEWVVHTGSEDRFVSARPWVELNLPTFGTARNHDLNDNGNDDTIIFHPASDNAKRIEVILF